MDLKTFTNSGGDRDRIQQNQMRLFIGFVVFGCFVNLINGPLTREMRPNLFDAILVICLVGVIAAQFVCIAFTSVLWSGGLRQRALLTTAATLLLVGAWAIGMFLTFLNTEYAIFRSRQIKELVVMVRLLPMILASAQLPAWLASAWLNWRIEPVGNTSPTTKPSLHIRDLLFATAYVGVVLTFTRWFCTGISEDFPSQIAEAALVVGVWSLVIACISLATLGVVIPLCLRIKLTALASIFLSLLFACSILAILLFVFWTISGFKMRAKQQQEMIMVLGSLTFSYALTVSAFFAIARKLGFVLRWGREGQSATSAIPLVVSTDKPEPEVPAIS